MSLGLTMGFHNGLAQEIIPDCPATTVMTMTIVKISISFGNALQYYLATKSINKLYPYDSGVDELDDGYRNSMTNNLVTSYKKLQSLFGPLILFIIGAIIGTVINLFMGFISLMIPATLISFIIIDIHRALFNIARKDKDVDGEGFGLIDHSAADDLLTIVDGRDSGVNYGSMASQQG